MNVRLFTRGPKGLALTPLGEAFQHHAATGVVALQQAIDSVAQGKLQGDSNIRDRRPADRGRPPDAPGGARADRASAATRPCI